MDWCSILSKVAIVVIIIKTINERSICVEQVEQVVGQVSFS